MNYHSNSIEFKLLLLHNEALRIKEYSKYTSIYYGILNIMANTSMQDNRNIINAFDDLYKKFTNSLVGNLRVTNSGVNKLDDKKEAEAKEVYLTNFDGKTFNSLEDIIKEVRKVNKKFKTRVDKEK